MLAAATSAPDTGTPIALWRQLQAVAACVMAVRAGRSGTAALEQVDPALRPGVQALVFEVWRSLARAENLRSQLVSRPPPAAADALLCAVLALAWREYDTPDRRPQPWLLQAPQGGARRLGNGPAFSQDGPQPWLRQAPQGGARKLGNGPAFSYEPFTLVNQAVEAAKRDPATKAQAGFINACLRRFLRERDALVAHSERDPVAQWNHPRWWIRRLQHDHPEHWQAILQADLQHAPMTLRVNLRRTTQLDYLALLSANGIDAVASGLHGVRLLRALPVQRIPGFDSGQVSVQDAAAQLAAPLLLQGHLPGTPMRVLDACAAPGGKSAHVLELADVELSALDIDPQRCARIRQTLDRLGLNATVVAADAARPQDWWDGQLFDAILLDAPCTASGIVRRHPDVPWLRRETDVATLVAVQAALLRALWPLLRMGGRMVYCTCSVFRDEGDNQIQTFVGHHSDALLLPSPGHLLPPLTANGVSVPDNPVSEHDGFFYALLEKRAA